jgi:hypothetical protein
VMENVAARDSKASNPSRGGRRPSPSGNNRRGALGLPPLARTTEQSPDISIARKRQVTVIKIICGVDVSSRSLHVRIGFDGPDCSFPNTTAFCRQHHVELVAIEATGGYEKQPFAQLWDHEPMAFSSLIPS